MKCIKHRCPYYFESDIFLSCLQFKKLVAIGEGCSVEDFNQRKNELQGQIINIYNLINELNDALEKVRNGQDV